MASNSKDSEPQGDLWWSFKTVLSTVLVAAATLAPTVYSLENGQQLLIGLLGSGVVVATAIALPRILKFEEPIKELQRRHIKQI